jgi:signal transduction histidine kinase
MRWRPRLTALLGGERPVLRVQLTLLYSGLFLGLLAAVLLATDVLFVRDSSRAGPHAVAHSTSSGHTFDLGPAAIGLIAAAVALAGAWWLAGRFLRPLRAIAAAARQISATNLHRRLDLRGPSDELTDLGRTLDDLFGRLEASFEAQRHFVANAAHELRTPLAGQRTLLQVALSDREASVESLRAACEEALELGDQQGQLIDSLLTLATSERGIEQWEAFDLGLLAHTVVLGRTAAAEALGVRLDGFLAAAPAVGDPRLVELLVVNLVENALRYNVEGGRVEISTAPRPGTATLTVSNTGPAVPPGEIERLFRPFQQIGGERVGHLGGHGLGLAIVRAIAEAHRAEISARGRPSGGLQIEVSFPSAPA